MNRRRVLMGVLHVSIIALVVFMTTTMDTSGDGKAGMHLISKLLLGLAIALGVFAAIMAAYAVRVSRRTTDSG